MSLEFELLGRINTSGRKQARVEEYVKQEVTKFQIEDQKSQKEIEKNEEKKERQNSQKKRLKKSRRSLSRKRILKTKNLTDQFKKSPKKLSYKTKAINLSNSSLCNSEKLKISKSLKKQTSLVLKDLKQIRKAYGNSNTKGIQAIIEKQLIVANQAMASRKAKLRKSSKFVSSSKKSTEPCSSKEGIQDPKDKSKDKHKVSSRLVLKYFNNPCKYYMKDLLIGLKGIQKKNSPLFYEHFLQNAKSQVFINTLLPPESEVDLMAKKIYLPPLSSMKKKTLILDLDETLIHSMYNTKNPSDLKLPIHLNKDKLLEVGVNIRPNSQKFLAEISKFYEVVIFTASHQCYANGILNILDPHNKFITYRVFRDHCVKTKEGILVKDLRIFDNRNLKDILLVDNANFSYGYQPYNGVPILPFFDDKKDVELLKLLEFLKEIRNEFDFREVIKLVFKPDLFQKFAMRPDILSRQLLNFFK